MRSQSKASDSLFVIQKHAARSLHYDFRLAMEGVLKSWAVPKGLPFKHGDRRLAIRVEDHPIEYGNFEGIIPAGNYGAGTVMVWDTGTYTVADDDPVRALEKGKLHFRLYGKKLRGEWALVRMKARDGEEQESWLIFKSETNHRPIAKTQDDRSALTRRSMKQISANQNVRWVSNRKVTTRRGARHSALRSHKTAPTADNGLKELPRSKPDFVSPMKARLVDKVPGQSGWIYEIKFDGVRAIAVKDGDKVRLISRNAHSLTDSFAEIARALRELPCQKAVLDGEIVALDDRGRSSFQLMQPFIRGGSFEKARPPILYYVFDLLNVEGRATTGLPLPQRKQMLQLLLKNAPDNVRFSTSFEGSPAKLLREIRRHGLEGVVGKKRDSTYEAGARSGAWIKIKCVNEQEFVIGGYTVPRGSRRHFGSLAVGYFDGKRLLYASKVGTGFDEALLASLHDQFQKLTVNACPFANLPSRRGDVHGISASQMKSCTWLKPALVCQVRFSEWTRDGHLRQPVFIGLREDKKPKQVVRETAGSRANV